jgi:hypothetical protein
VKVVKSLRSALALGRARLWHHNRADDVLKGTPAPVEEKGGLKFLSVLRVAAAGAEVLSPLSPLWGNRRTRQSNTEHRK